MQALRLAIESFVRSSKQPALTEPGEDLIHLNGTNLSLDNRPGFILLQTWDLRRNLSRRVVSIESQNRSHLVLKTERFGKKPGTLTLLDLSRPSSQTVGRKTARLEFREGFRRFLRRDFPGYKIAELSTEANLEDSLSPSYPRGLLVKGSSGLATIGAPPDAACVESVLSFGLIWLDYLRRRERAITVQGLVVYLPAGREKAACLRIPFLDPSAASYSVFLFTEEGYTRPVDLSDYGNVDTHLEPCRRDPDLEPSSIPERLSAIEGVETIALSEGSLSLRVQGLEFARLTSGKLIWGLETNRESRASNMGEIGALAQELARVRAPRTCDRRHPLFLRNRESWLESQVRAHLESIDPTLCCSPIIGQVPAFAGGERG